MKYPFIFPMKRSERIMGCVCILIHAVVLPEILAFLLGIYAPGITAPYYMLVFNTSCFLLILIVMFRYLRESFSDFISGFWRAIQSVILGIVLYYALFWAVTIFLTSLMMTANPNTQAFYASLNKNFNVMLIVSVVLAPIVEEAMYRGALFGTIRQKSRLLAYLVSIMLFSLAHLWRFLLFGYSWDVLLLLLQYVPASIALAWCYERGGTIWAPILLHSAINLTALFI